MSTHKQHKQLVNRILEEQKSKPKPLVVIETNKAIVIPIIESKPVIYQPVNYSNYLDKLYYLNKQNRKST